MGLLGDVFGDIGGIVGSFTGGGDRDEALRRMEQAQKTYEDLHPTITSQAIGNAYMSADPATRAAQMDALSTLQAKYRAGGLDAIDQARLNDISNQVNRNAQVQRAAVADQAARMGMAGSGHSLVQQMVGGQAAANAGSCPSGAGSSRSDPGSGRRGYWN